MNFKLLQPSWIALGILVIFILDTILHFVIIPFEQLTFSLISFKGDIDFINIGILNVALRLIAYASLAFTPQKLGRFLPVTLLTYFIPTLYLIVDSWWVFENYIFLYGYWFVLVMLTIGFTVLLFIGKLQIIKPIYAVGISFGLGLMIFLVYVDIMGLDWPYEFVYAFFQRIIYEPVFLFVVYLTAKQIKGV